jgi:hypothetical protein
VDKFLRVPEIDEAFTERGERVYKTLEITVYPPDFNPVRKVIQCERGVGFTEEWIEDTIQGALQALAKDFPNDVYKVNRLKPNQISLEYAGVQGLVQ